ncbi:MAG: 23S rRNA (adenine(2503)-C(2))-methyltransferase RlmN [bacterium]
MNILEIISEEPKYRQDQLYKAWFNVDISGYDKISTFPKELREKLKNFPWISAEPAVIEKSKLDGTVKALLKLRDGLFIETVLLGREKKTKEGGQRHTICVSSQVGCAMGCIFCATGRLGFKRNLDAMEIISQYRFWQKYLAENQGGAIDNIVVMGQGEPLLNYENIKTALAIILKNTEIGPSKITISTAGIKTGMEQILTDKDFPPARVAISLHSAIEKTRQQIVPSHSPGFLEFLPKWTEKYHKKFGSRAYFISLEYIMLRNINDDEKHLKALATLAAKLGHIKINLIPWNELPFTQSPAEKLKGSPDSVIKDWQNKLMQKGFVCTIRHSQGQDISAACGQLAGEK